VSISGSTKQADCRSEEVSHAGPLLRALCVIRYEAGRRSWLAHGTNILMLDINANWQTLWPSSAGMSVRDAES
jgi:hypothetical protein